MLYMCEKPTKNSVLQCPGIFTIQPDMRILYSQHQDSWPGYLQQLSTSNKPLFATTARKNEQKQSPPGISSFHS